MGLDRLIGFDAQLLSESFFTALNIFILFSLRDCSFESGINEMFLNLRSGGF